MIRGLRGRPVKGIVPGPVSGGGRSPGNRGRDSGCVSPWANVLYKAAARPLSRVNTPSCSSRLAPLLHHGGV